MYNRVVLIGRLIADPELRTTPQGVSVTSFRIAVNRPYVNNSNEREADFIDCRAWRANAEFICKYFTKGKLIGIEGAIRTSNYTDKEGVKRYRVEVLVDRAFFTESKGGGGASPMSASPDVTHSLPQGFDYVPDDDEDLPF